jgi:hypothetical protein
MDSFKNIKEFFKKVNFLIIIKKIILKYYLKMKLMERKQIILLNF